MKPWEFKEDSINLPTILKSSPQFPPVTVEDGVVGESNLRDIYHAVDKNKRVLVKDSTSVSGRHLEVFSKRENFMLETKVDMPVIDLFSSDKNKLTQMPGTRMPNTERRPTPPPSYEGTGRGRGNRNQPPPRYQRQNGQEPRTYVYYVPGEGPANTRDSPPYRSGRSPAHQLVDRQSSQEYLFDKQLRKNFVFRVYLLLSILLSFTFLCCIITTLVIPIKHFFIEYWWLSIIFSILYLGFSIALMCFTSLRRSYPTNLILLICMCICITIPMCVVVAFYSTKTVLLALGTTLLIAVSISFLAKVCPCDVTGCGMLVMILALVFSLYALVTVIVSMFIYEPILYLVYGGIGTVLFSFFLFFDTQQILGGRRVEISPEEYILGTVLLYIDIIMIFLMLLNIYGYAD